MFQQVTIEEAIAFSESMKLNEDQTEELTSTKKEGMARAESNADPAWKDAAGIIVRDLCASRFELTADDVLERLSEIGVSTHDNRALGSIMLRAAKMGLCRKTDRVVNSRLPQRHSRPIAIWQSIVFGQ